MGYKGKQIYPFNLTAASQLERNRLVKITAGVPAYTALGEEADAYTSARGNENDYVIGVTPLVGTPSTFFLGLAGTVSAQDPLFAVADGKVKTADYTVFNRSEQDTPGSPSTGRYLVPAAGWASVASSANKIAYYSGSAWTYTAPTAGDILYITEEGLYVIYSGSAWVDVKVQAHALETGVSGADIVVYSIGNSRKITQEDISGDLNQGAKIVVAGQSTSETDADATITVLDGRILATDIGFATLEADTAGQHVLTAVCTAGTLTITLAGNGGAGTIANYQVLRSLDN